MFKEMSRKILLNVMNKKKIENWVFVWKLISFCICLLLINILIIHATVSLSLVKGRSH